jgi:preprotein translocase subunit SecE
MQPGTWIQDARQYLVEVQAEAKKVTFPSRKETLAGAAGVVVISSIFVAFLFLVDITLAQLLQWTLG